MNLFVSYAFNDDNRWIEELAIPLIRAFGFDVLTGRHMEGDIIVESVDARMRECRGCIGFTTRRDPLADGKFSTHQWVLDELAVARALKLTVVEVREDGVQVQGAAFSANGFGGWFRARCDEAGLPHCSAHGLRKAGATVAAENGATDRQLMALYDWSSQKQANTSTPLRQTVSGLQRRQRSCSRAIRARTTKCPTLVSHLAI
jgi:hypothetical protein